MKKRGRPPGEPKDLLSLDDALDEIRKSLEKKYGARIAGKCSWAKGTLYNKICQGKINRWKKGKYVFVSREEVLKQVS